MNHKLFILSTVLLLFGCDGGNTERHEVNGFYSGVEGDDASMVYICTGPQSKRYHCDENCCGLDRCSADVEAVTLDEAEEMDRTPCGFCY